MAPTTFTPTVPFAKTDAAPTTPAQIPVVPLLDPDR
jgi:hypothetical protein